MDPRPRWLTARMCSPYRAWLKVDLLYLGAAAAAADPAASAAPADPAASAAPADPAAAGHPAAAVQDVPIHSHRLGRVLHILRISVTAGLTTPCFMGPLGVGSWHAWKEDHLVALLRSVWTRVPYSYHTRIILVSYQMSMSPNPTYTACCCCGNYGRRCAKLVRYPYISAPAPAAAAATHGSTHSYRAK